MVGLGKVVSEDPTIKLMEGKDLELDCIKWGVRAEYSNDVLTAICITLNQLKSLCAAVPYVAARCVMFHVGKEKRVKERDIVRLEFLDRAPT